MNISTTLCSGAKNNRRTYTHTHRRNTHRSSLYCPFCCVRVGLVPPPPSPSPVLEHTHAKKFNTHTQTHTQSSARTRSLFVSDVLLRSRRTFVWRTRAHAIAAHKHLDHHRRRATRIACARAHIDPAWFLVPIVPLFESVWCGKASCSDQHNSTQSVDPSDCLRLCGCLVVTSSVFAFQALQHCVCPSVSVCVCMCCSSEHFSSVQVRRVRVPSAPTEETLHPSCCCAEIRVRSIVAYCWNNNN